MILGNRWSRLAARWAAASLRWLFVVGCTHPHEPILRRSEDGQPGWACLDCGRWRPLARELADLRPRLRSTVRPSLVPSFFPVGRVAQPQSPRRIQ